MKFQGFSRGAGCCHGNHYDVTVCLKVMPQQQSCKDSQFVLIASCLKTQASMKSVLDCMKRNVVHQGEEVQLHIHFTLPIEGQYHDIQTKELIPEHQGNCNN